ncbi:hypothetical protein Efla_001761 [Eimeria flavescens]
MDGPAQKSMRLRGPVRRDLFRPSAGSPPRARSEDASLTSRPRRLGSPCKTDSSVVLGILQGIAKKTVERAIVEHHQKGGQAVSGARVRIIPNSLRLKGCEAADAAIPSLVQSFKVRPSASDGGTGKPKIEPVASFVDPDFRAAYELSPGRFSSASGGGSYAAHTESWQTPSWEQAAQGQHLSGDNSLPTTWASSTPLPLMASFPGPHSSTCSLSVGCCSSAPDWHGPTWACLCTAGVGGRPQQPFTNKGTARPCMSCGAQCPRSPSNRSNHVPVEPTPPAIDPQHFADQGLEGFTGSTRLKSLAPKLKGLLKDILKLWATKSCYDESARSMKAWMTRRRCSYGEEATEELALKEIPHQFDKYRNLERVVDKMQRQLLSKLRSTVLRPILQLSTAEEEASLQQLNLPLLAHHNVGPSFIVDLRYLATHITRLNTLYAQIQLLVGVRQPPASHIYPTNRLPSSSRSPRLLALPQVRWEELIQERDELSARVTAQQELLCQLSEVNQRQISELVRLKGRHRALCRISPGVELPLKPADAKSVFVASQGVSTLLLKSQPALGYRTKSSVPGAANKVQAFDFDRVYGENATTQEIYAQLKDLTPSVLCGNTLSVVVLGPRMSGKTLTLFFPLSQPCASDDATRRNPRSEGLVVHYLHHLFELIKEKCLLAPREGSTDVKLSCTCVEVHNEVLLDAFDPHPRTDRLKPDAVKNARTGSLRVTNLRTLGDDFAADSVAALSEDNPLLQSILDELRSALMRRHEASRQSHVVFTTCVEVTDRAMGLHHEGKLVLAMLADSSDPTLKPPFDASAANCRSSASSASQDNAPAATHLTNRAVSCLGKIIKGKLHVFPQLLTKTGKKAILFYKKACLLQ